MRILFIHPNFPAQFRHMAQYLGARPECDVVYLTANERPEWKIPGVRKALFKEPGPSRTAHYLARHFEEAAGKGEAVYGALLSLRRAGFSPDVVVAHSGWGTSMFVKEAFPRARFLGYFEWYYRVEGADADFDPAEPPTDRSRALIRVKNAPILLDMEACDGGYTPTRWQHVQLPRAFASSIEVRHDGINTEFFTPEPELRGALGRLDAPGLGKKAGLDEDHVCEVVTYAARGMEPYRGFPQFMEAAAHILDARPDSRIVVAGENRVCYGKKPHDASTYKDQALERLAAMGADMSRIHFTGPLPYGKYRQLLRTSSVHVYLTRPFVLSWSFLEAMACGCLLVASNTPPVREVIRHGENGVLTDFFDPRRIARHVIDALARQDEMEPPRRAARREVEERFALSRLLPEHIRFVTRGMESGRGASRKMDFYTRSG